MSTENRAGTHEGPRSPGPFCSFRGRLSPLDRVNVRCLGALLPLGCLELDLRTFRERLEALAGDACVVDEQILRSVIGGDEAVPLVVAEPLHSAGCQLIHLPLPTTGTGVRACSCTRASAGRCAFPCVRTVPCARGGPRRG